MEEVEEVGEVVGSDIYYTSPAGGYIKIDIALRKDMRKVDNWLMLPSNINWWERPVCAY